MGSFPISFGNQYILVAINYVFKWIKATDNSIYDAKVVMKFLKKIFLIDSKHLGYLLVTVILIFATKLLIHY